MDTIAQSFANLVKTNNGFFKSAAQANFLLSQSSYEYATCGSVMGNSYNMHYTCDDSGVTLVQKYTKAKGFVTTWERKVEGVVSLQDAKEIKRLTRLVKSTEKSIASRQARWDSGMYAAEFPTIEGAKMIFDDCMTAERQQLVALNNKLATLK